MEPVSVITIITTVIPLVTAAVKKIINTGRLEESNRKAINGLIPIVLGILSSGLYEWTRSHNWITALAVGLGSGGAASSLRDVDKNLNLVGSLRSLFKPEPPDAS